MTDYYFFNNCRKIQLLLENGADPNIYSSKFGSTLYYAYKYNRCVDELLAAGAKCKDTENC
jgi:hypothetical protein